MVPELSSYKLCLSTIDDLQAAEKIAKQLVKQKLVACVNISSPMTSIYHWQNKLVQDKEFLLLMKTSAEKIELLQNTLLKLHSYDLPEFIVVDIEQGSPDYLNWLQANLI